MRTHVALVGGGALTLAVAFAVLGPGFGPAQETHLVPSAAEGPAVAPAPDADPDPASLAGGGDLEIVLARPLFAPDRLPSEAEEVALSAGGSAPRLSGIVHGGAMKRAFFDGPDGKPVGLGEGDAIGSFRVRRIEATRVILSGPDGDEAAFVAGDPSRAPPDGAAASGTPAASADGLPFPFPAPPR